MTCAVQAANEIVARKEVWGFDAGGDLILVSAQTMAFANDGGDLDVTMPVLDPTPGRFNVLRIADQSTATDPATGRAQPAQHGIGRLTVRTVAAGQFATAPAGLAVLFAPLSTQWGEAVNRELPEGVTSIGDISILGPMVDGIATTDVVSRDAVKLFATISGDLHGTVSVGEVQRFVALGRPVSGGFEGGSIASGALLEATKAMPITYAVGGTSDSAAINFVRLGGTLTGIIRATDAGIFRVLVGTSDQPGAIYGTIDAPKGSIGIVECFGDIGSTGWGTPAPATIRAGESIRQIRSKQTDVGGIVLQHDVTADVLAGSLYLPTDRTVSRSAALPAAIATDAARLGKIGSIGLIESGGDLVGTIKALNLGRSDGATAAAGRSADGRRGIVVRGEVRASVEVAWNVDGADLIAAGFGSIEIGNQLNGSIVAFETAPLAIDSGGKIRTVRVGYGPQLVADPDAIQLPDVPLAISAEYPKGFVGSDRPPMNRDCYLFNGFDANGDPLPPVERTGSQIWFPPPLPGEDGSKDGVIFAREIENVDLAAMTQTPTYGTRAGYRPRIEVKNISKRLDVVELSSGAIWSGRMGFARGTDVRHPEEDRMILGRAIFELTSPHRQVVDTTERAYYYYTGAGEAYLPRRPMAVRTAWFGCVGPAADVYLWGNFDGVKVEGDMLGEINIPHLVDGRRLVVGGRLGASAAGDTACAEPTGSSGNPPPGTGRWATFLGEEPSPRGHDLRTRFVAGNDGYSFVREPEPSIALYGAIRLEDSKGLDSNILIHTNAPLPAPGDPWSQDLSFLNGLVWLGARDLPTEDPAPRIMGRSVFTDPSLQLPRYEARNVSLSTWQRDGELYGGAVGLVPYAIHYTECMPPYTEMDGGYPYARQTFVNTPNHPLAVSFYGPPASGPDQSDRSQWLRLWLLDESTTPPEWVDVTGRIWQQIREDGRRINFFALNNDSSGLPTLPAGRYKVTLDDEVYSGGAFNLLRVEGSAVNGPTVLQFRLVSCSVGGTPNPADIVGGGVDGMSPDGTVDGTDFIAFINAFAIGDVLADVTGRIVYYPISGVSPPQYLEVSLPDGTVDGSDFIAFINGFSAGCE